MKEELVTLDTARLAKIKGFNIKVVTYISDISGYSPILDLIDYNARDIGGLYSAPTQALLQRWLREKHNIHMHVAPNADYTKYKVFVHKASYLTVKYEYYTTYEQALEKGLEEGLKLINNV